MILNILLAIVIPWVLCTFHLLKKDRRIIIVIGSFSSVVSFTVNELGSYYGFWTVYPFLEQKSFSTLPFNLGIYPILGIYLIYFIRKYKRPYITITLFCIFTTALEAIYYLLGKVSYGNGWTITFTFFSYLFPYILVYWYYLYLKKMKILD